MPCQVAVSHARETGLVSGRLPPSATAGFMGIVNEFVRGKAKLANQFCIVSALAYTGLLAVRITCPDGQEGQKTHVSSCH